MEPATIILALCIPLAFGVGWRVGAGVISRVALDEIDDVLHQLATIRAAEAKRHEQRMAALVMANAANRAKRDAS